jgi:endonuclease/exonuclease/phosphatase family metal-dependent hydrolase
LNSREALVCVTKGGKSLTSRFWNSRSLFSMTLAGALSACAMGFNYTDPQGPRFGSALPGPAPDAEWRQPLRVVSFNLQYGRAVEDARDLLTQAPQLDGADVVLLQEMDAEGTRRLADALGMAWVYHPATNRPRTGRDFGNAVLTKWPIADDEKLVLPHRSIFGRTLRTATVATIMIGQHPVRVYSVHLATPVNQAYRERAKQMRTVLRDAAVYPHVIIGGDLNSGSLGTMAADRGYYWPTRDGPSTVFFGRVDHIFMKGFDAPGELAAGTVDIPEGISDHRPVWAVGAIR